MKFKNLLAFLALALVSITATAANKPKPVRGPILTQLRVVSPAPAPAVAPPAPTRVTLPPAPPTVYCFFLGTAYPVNADGSCPFPAQDS